MGLADVQAIDRVAPVDEPGRANEHVAGRRSAPARAAPMGRAEVWLRSRRPAST